MGQIPITKQAEAKWQVLKHERVIKEGFDNERDAHEWACKWLKSGYKVMKPSYSIY